MDEVIQALPRDIEAERAVLATMLVNPVLCDEVALRVRESDFFDQNHAQMFRVILDLWNSSKDPDLPLVIKALKKNKQSASVEWNKLLGEILNLGASVINATYYADTVANTATMRALVSAGNEITTLGYSGEDPQAAVARSEQLVFAVGEQRASAEVHPASTIMHTLMEVIDRREQRGCSDGLKTGFYDLDKITGGLQDGEVTIIAARPSMGKSALAFNIASNVAIDEQKSVLITSLEMGRSECVERMLCSLARVNSSNVKNGTCSQEQKRKLVEAQAVLSQANIFIDDEAMRTMSQIAATARRLKRSSGLDLLVIDYLQLITPDNPRDPRQEQVSHISRKLKHLARELSIPVICLAQLNRQNEQGNNKRPSLHHLRESGSIEQDADVVLFVHRDEYYATAEEEKRRLSGQADLFMAKNRNGRIGDVKLTWAESWTRFENASAAAYEAGVVDQAPRGGRDFADMFDN